MFFKEFWRYKNLYKTYMKRKSIISTDETLNEEKGQIQSLSYDSQNILNTKSFMSIRKLFSKSTQDMKKQDLGITNINLLLLLLLLLL